MGTQVRRAREIDVSRLASSLCVALSVCLFVCLFICSSVSRLLCFLPQMSAVVLDDKPDGCALD